MTNDPNKGIPPELLRRYTEASLSRCLANLIDAITCHLEDGDLDWSDIASGQDELTLRRELASGMLTIKRLNAIAQAFGLEPHIIFRPRVPRYTAERGDQT